MVPGFNHNIRYKGVIFHVQTEDSGITMPHIITLLYRGGTIVSSKKTSYADIIKADGLAQIVEEVMKEQHKDMLRRLKAGEFDEKVFGPGSSAGGETAAEEEKALGGNADCAAGPTACASPRQQQKLDEIILDYLVAGDQE